MEFMIQLYINNASEAIDLYTKAFDANLLFADYTPENAILHSELLAYGQKIAISDTLNPSQTGTVFQIDVRMKKEADVKKAYEILKDGSVTNVELGSVFWSPCMVDFIDKFGVRWCLFAE